MGGRGASATKVVVQSKRDFLAKKGLASPVSDYLVDKMRGNKNFSSGNQREKFTKEAHNAIDSYHDRREKAIQEYNSKVKAGEIRTPTLIEEKLRMAQGHSDNESVRAARRLLEKRGYDWRTGKKIK